MLVSTRPTARQLVVAFAAGAAIFLALDAVWLTQMVDRLYRPALGHVMRPDFDVLAAAAFYLIYLSGMVGFAVVPAWSVRSAAVRGACFGLVAYATYDLTNQATLRGWPWHVTFIDLFWGAFITATSSAVAHRVARPPRV